MKYGNKLSSDGIVYIPLAVLFKLLLTQSNSIFFIDYEKIKPHNFTSVYYND